MPAKWFRRVDGKEVGPHSAEEIKSLAQSGELRPEDLIWKEGLAEWVPARKVQGLFDGVKLSNIPPAPRPAPEVIVQTPRKQRVWTSLGSKFTSGCAGTFGVFAAIGIAILLVCGGGIIFLMNAFDNDDEPEEVNVNIDGNPLGGFAEAQERRQAAEEARRADEAAAQERFDEWLEQWYFDGHYTSDNVSSIALTQIAIDGIATDHDLTEVGKRAARIRDRIDAAMDAARETARAREVAAGERPTGDTLTSEEADKLLSDMDAALVD